MRLGEVSLASFFGKKGRRRLAKRRVVFELVVL